MNKRLNILIGTILLSLMVLILTRGIEAYLNQKNISLKNNISELVSTNQWIKYQISDKMSLDKIETYAKNNLGMVEITNENMKYVKVSMKKIAEGTVVAEENWQSLLKKNVEEIFDGQKFKW